jgi:hypothetical protein
MRKTVLGVVAMGMVILASAGLSFASGPNCAMVKKDLSMGRTPDDIAERMMTTVDEVKKCQAQGDQASPGNSGNTPGAENSGKKDDKAAGGEHEGH